MIYIQRLLKVVLMYQVSQVSQVKAKLSKLYPFNFTLHMILFVRSRHTGEWPNILFNLINSTWLFPIFSCLVHLTLFWNYEEKLKIDHFSK